MQCKDPYTTTATIGAVRGPQLMDADSILTENMEFQKSMMLRERVLETFSCDSYSISSQ